MNSFRNPEKLRVFLSYTHTAPTVTSDWDIRDQLNKALSKGSHHFIHLVLIGAVWSKVVTVKLTNK